MSQSEVSNETRHIVVGCNSYIWSILSRSTWLNFRAFHAISHRELEGFKFYANDSVWIFSYSRVVAENDTMFRCLAAAGVSNVVYVTSASTNVISITNCYEYPRIKQLAHESAIRICDAKVLSIGLFYTDQKSLPGGITASTSAKELALFMGAPSWADDGEVTHLFRAIERPFATGRELFIYKRYGELQRLCGSFPCLMRPIDLVLRIFGMRWYGYLYLSNRLWFTTTL